MTVAGWADGCKEAELSIANSPPPRMAETAGDATGTARAGVIVAEGASVVMASVGMLSSCLRLSGSAGAAALDSVPVCPAVSSTRATEMSDSVTGATTGAAATIVSCCTSCTPVEVCSVAAAVGMLGRAGDSVEPSLPSLAELPWTASRGPVDVDDEAGQ